MKTITEIPFKDRVFVLAGPMTVHTSVVGGVYYCENHRMHLLGWGQSEEGAFRCFCEDFAVLYDGLVGRTDRELTQDAIEARDSLAVWVKEIKVAPKDHSP